MDTNDLIALHCKAYNDGALPMYTITENPADYPGKFVVRMHVVLTVAVNGSREMIGPVVTVEDTLDAARARLAPLSLYRSPRQEGDLAVIVETWF